MFKLTPTFRSPAASSMRASKSWDRTVLLAGAQLIATGAILLGGSVAIRAVHAPVKHDPELAAIAERTALVSTSAAERFVLERSAKIAPSAASPGLSPNSEPELLPPLVRADFTEPVPAPPPTSEIAALRPADIAEVPMAQMEPIIVELATPLPDQSKTEAVPQSTALTSVMVEHIAPPMLPPPVAASMAPTPSEADIEQPAKIKSKPRSHDVEPKKRYSPEPDRQHTTTRRVQEARHKADYRQESYARPVRLDRTPKWLASACSGGPARWVGNRIYWASRC